MIKKRNYHIWSLDSDSLKNVAVPCASYCPHFPWITSLLINTKLLKRLENIHHWWWIWFFTNFFVFKKIVPKSSYRVKRKNTFYLTVESLDPDIMMFSSYCKHSTEPVWPVNTWTHSNVLRSHICESESLKIHHWVSQYKHYPPVHIITHYTFIFFIFLKKHFLAYKILVTKVISKYQKFK